MTQEQVEFLISQYIDGTISGEDEGVLRGLLETSEEARKALEEYRKLDEVMKNSMPIPEMRWEKVGEVISSAVGVSEEDEQAISEYLDGTLADLEQAELEKRVAGEPGMARAMTEYKSLDAMVRKGMPVPAVKWDLLAQRISEAVDAQGQRERMFIGNWLKQPMRLAAAAVVLIALGVGIFVAMPGGHKPVMTIIINEPEKVEGTKVATMDFDMSPSLAQSGTDWYSAGDVVSMPSELDVAFSTSVLQDTSPF
jgi:anti-sigma factor RsiW